MSSTYTGNPSNNPASITIPSDGDLRDAASVNPAFEGLADQVAWTQAGLVSQLNKIESFIAADWASNWPNWTPTEDANLNADYVRIGGSGYLPITGQTTWLAMGGEAALPTSGSNTMTVVQSSDGGKTFQSLNFPSTGMTVGSFGQIYDIAGDTQGGVVVIAKASNISGPQVKVMSLSSGTWTTATTAYGGSGYTGAFPTSLYFDATANVYVYGDVFALSTIPVASTTSTLHTPTGLPSGSSSVLTSLIVPKGDGSLVVVPATQSGTVWAHSAHYPSPTSTTPTYGTFPVVNTDIITAGDYGSYDGKYMLAKYDGSSVTHFLLSADGVTWTTAAGSVLGQIVGLANLAGRIWIALRSDYLMYYSIDAGATWTPCVNKLSGNVNQFKGFKSNAFKNQIAAFGSFSYKNQSTPTESRMMITSQITGVFSP